MLTIAKTANTVGRMTRAQHPHPEIEKAVRDAESRGWRVLAGGSHTWGLLLCPRRNRDGCRVVVWSAPKAPDAHAEDIRRCVKDDCPHGQGGEP